MLGSHKKFVHKSSEDSIMESIEAVVQQCYEDENINIITDMQKWVTSPFTQCTGADLDL